MGAEYLWLETRPSGPLPDRRPIYGSKTDYWCLGAALEPARQLDNLSVTGGNYQIGTGRKIILRRLQTRAWENRGKDRAETLRPPEHWGIQTTFRRCSPALVYRSASFSPMTFTYLPVFSDLFTTFLFAAALSGRLALFWPGFNTRSQW